MMSFTRNFRFGYPGIYNLVEIFEQSETFDGTSGLYVHDLYPSDDRDPVSQYLSFPEHVIRPPSLVDG